MTVHVCRATGWTWDYVLDAMTLPRLAAFARHWKLYPPLRSRDIDNNRLRPAQESEPDLADLMAMFGPNGGVIR